MSKNEVVGVMYVVNRICCMLYKHDMHSKGREQTDTVNECWQGMNFDYPVVTHCPSCGHTVSKSCGDKFTLALSSLTILSKDIE